MSNFYQRRMSLAGLDLDGLSVGELRALVRHILDAGIHGLCFSPLVEGQGPGDRVEEAQIRERLTIIRPFVRWIRTFSCTDGNELIPGVARSRGLKTLAGVWLGEDGAQNEAELANAIRLARDGQVDILGVGNEVLLRGDLVEDELLEFIHRAKAALPGTPVGYVDAYFKFVDHPRITAACDVILANCYPFWEGCPAEHALLYMKEMHRRAARAAQGKPVIVSETGWPDTGSPTSGAVPSFENAVRYFVNTCRWAEEEGIEVFYFSAFDEAWKVVAEGDVGAYWGLWDKDGRPKYA
jgi:exo-beta-1,3-glucanase (GH17 family)